LDGAALTFFLLEHSHACIFFLLLLEELSRLTPVYSRNHHLFVPFSHHATNATDSRETQYLCIVPVNR
jgi:hypothetical protein